MISARYKTSNDLFLWNIKKGDFDRTDSVTYNLVGRSISRAELNEGGRAFILSPTLDFVAFVRKDAKIYTK